MQSYQVGVTKSDLIKYPFLKETADYIRQLRLQIDDLTSIQEKAANRFVNENLAKNSGPFNKLFN